MGAGASAEGEVTAQNSHMTTGVSSSPTAFNRTASLRSFRAASHMSSPSTMRSTSVIPGHGATFSSTGSVRTPSITAAAIQRKQNRQLHQGDRKGKWEIVLSRSGFSSSKIELKVGQTVKFRWDDPKSAGYNIIQVVHDGDQYKPVVGGFYSGPVCQSGEYDFTPGIQGEYKFVSGGIRCTPLTVTVQPRTLMKANVTDSGFVPNIMRIDEGNSIRFQWNNCSVQHAVTEVRYCAAHQGFIPVRNLRPQATTTGSYRHDFRSPGLYYFQTESTTQGHKHLCAVHVREVQREYKVQIKDNCFDPQILVIEEGDRVWFYWDKNECERQHCVYQIHLPDLGHRENERYKGVKDGFRWTAPSKAGLMSHEFFEPGIFYFSDQNQHSCAEYLGTIIVKPKQMEHYVEIGGDVGFLTSVNRVGTGDRIWWLWEPDEIGDAQIKIQELQKCLSGKEKIAAELGCNGNCEKVTESDGDLMTNVGLATAVTNYLGAYHYRIADSDMQVNTNSVIVNPAPRNHTVHVTEHGFEPKRLLIRPNDRVWWIWQTTTKPQNIVQVSHQGKHIHGGFCSGAPVDSPSAYVHTFKSSGVHYFISQNSPNVFGAVIVLTQPKVHEIIIEDNEIVPDPVAVNIGDVVTWHVKEETFYDIVEVRNVDDMLEERRNPGQEMAPRMILNRAMGEKGVYHFTGRALDRTNLRREEYDAYKSRTMDEMRLSSVLVDDPPDSLTISLSGSGFLPNDVTIRRGRSICFDWLGQEASYKVVHVHAPSNEGFSRGSDAGMPVTGEKAFNSGKAVPDHSFIYTFDDPGTYCVQSSGSTKHQCMVTVLGDGEQCKVPKVAGEYIGGNRSQPVPRNYKVRLESETPDTQIFYTLDGSRPELHRAATKKYDPRKGIRLETIGLCFIRAIAVKKGYFTSEIWTSRRFRVLSKKIVSDDEDDDLNTIWQMCRPQIQGVPTTPGVSEVFWEKPTSQDCLRLIRGYQVFLNDVSYCPMFPSDYSAVSVVGMSGGREYNVYLEVYPVDNSLEPLRSNTVILSIPETTPGGGPLISKEVTKLRNALAVVWAGIGTPQFPIQGYQVYLNGQKCGRMVLPDEKSNRCRVVIEGCNLETEYNIYVESIPDGVMSSPRRSNDLSYILPLDISEIRLPPESERQADEDLYREFLEIREGSGIITQKPAPPVQQPRATESVHTLATGRVQMLSRYVSDPEHAVPVVEVHTSRDNEAVITWQLTKQPHPNYNLTLYVVNVVGPRFTPNAVNSDISYDCMVKTDDEEVPMTQHIWNINSGTQCRVTGLSQGTKYRMYVTAVYKLKRGIEEAQITSAVVYYATDAPPEAPDLRVKEVDLYQATVEWEVPRMQRNVSLTGYNVFLDGQLMGPSLHYKTRETTIDGLRPGKSVRVQVQPVTNSSSPSGSCGELQLSCPMSPRAPHIEQQPSYREGVVVIGWQHSGNDSLSREEDITSYAVYVDGRQKGEVKVSVEGNQHGYQHTLTGLNPGQVFDVTVKAIAGGAVKSGPVPHAYCLCDSSQSNILPVQASAPPDSPQLYVEGLTPQGIDLVWKMPQQFGEATISGFQLLKDGRLFGSIIPPDVTRTTIRDVSLGDRVRLQILALTDHPVGREGDSGIASSGANEYEQMFGSRFAGCRPGPQVTVHFSGLVAPPSRIWTERVTGSSALVCWSIVDKLRSHFVQADSFVVTWWPGDRPEHDINSQVVKGNQYEITDLKPDVEYTVVVESRKTRSYNNIDEEDSKDRSQNFILASKSSPIKLRSASPPDAPGHLSVSDSTNTSIEIQWDAPRERGAEVIGIRIDCEPIGGHSGQPVVQELMPDQTSAIISGLAERCSYQITVTAITEEYFRLLPERHRWSKLRRIPRDEPVPRNEPWLPQQTVVADTSVTVPPADVRVLRRGVHTLTVGWDPATVQRAARQGTNRLTGTVIRWVQMGKNGRESASSMSQHVQLSTKDSEFTIKDLISGYVYKITVEAVVSVKTTVGVEHDSNRRTTHVLGKPLMARTRAPVEPPRPHVTGFSSNTIQLYWEKPLLCTQVARDEFGNPLYVRRYLAGYTLHINGKAHMRLSSSAQSCLLVKCRPGKSYKIELMALTCVEEDKKERKRKKYGRSGPRPEDDEEEDWDVSGVEALRASTPALQQGGISSANIKFHSAGKADRPGTVGELQLEWSLQSHESLVKQFNVHWSVGREKNEAKKYLDADVRRCVIPVDRRKELYRVTLTPVYNKDMMTQPPQPLYILTPGAPDAPTIFLHSVERDEFTIEWGEPRLYANKIGGYQVYLNSKPVGDTLAHNFRKAVIPCKPNKEYKVGLMAIPAERNIDPSPLSNTLFVSTDPSLKRLVSRSDSRSRDETDRGTRSSKRHRSGSPESDDGIPLKVLRVTDSSISLDWSGYRQTQNVHAYKLQWNSSHQPAPGKMPWMKEVQLSAAELSASIDKCFPGTNHYIRLVALGRKGQVVDRSRQLTVQTSAPPEQPRLSLKACNYNYITVEWNKPQHFGEAEIIGYKMYVNDVQEARLGPHDTQFTYSQGKWVNQYSFKLQAVTADERLNSRPSDPLVVTMPGAKPQNLQQKHSEEGDKTRVAWDTPVVARSTKERHRSYSSSSSDSSSSSSGSSTSHSTPPRQRS